jgi:hypothetical protein
LGEALLAHKVNEAQSNLIGRSYLVPQSPAGENNLWEGRQISETKIGNLWNVRTAGGFSPLWFVFLIAHWPVTNLPNQAHILRMM